ncbi:hypothetical protein BUALT_Bualt11G0085900 [Buddleja alternifolia]|uniref:Factor of DNA methylation 1-5/IDN2 domain-containing protein n=1 Tax=Buddleja alternifolia TaxID=168488 RepID=A0AAV6X463_9LAMI|nr:hypothetical protein BUALT_Bualt11G0085900 [Buddleja alternifolia]
MKVVQLCTLGDSEMKDPNRHPFKTVPTEDSHKKTIDEEEEKLKNLRTELGEEAYTTSTIDLLEMGKYNASGRCIVPELWNRNLDILIDRDVNPIALDGGQNMSCVIWYMLQRGKITLYALEEGCVKFESHKLTGRMWVHVEPKECNEIYPVYEKTDMWVVQLCTLWDNEMKDPNWHPFKTIPTEYGRKRTIDEEDEKLKNLRNELGEEA